MHVELVLAFWEFVLHHQSTTQEPSHKPNSKCRKTHAGFQRLNKGKGKFVANAKTSLGIRHGLPD